LNEFNPNGLVTRAEYATVFSRVLFWSKYNQSEWPYYEKHIAALKEAGILTKDDPTADEYRGWVMLMMYRSANTPLKATNETAKEEVKADEATWAVDKIANPASTYCVEQGWEIEIKEDKDGGQYGVCKLKDGTEVEEWEYFRANHKDEAATWAVAEASRGALAEAATWTTAEVTTWTTVEAATWATATTWAAE
jgi:putative hemolysin